MHADEVRDAVRQDARLARAGAGEDQQRAIGGRDGASLLRVEGPDDLLRALLAAGGHDGRVCRGDGGRGVLAWTRGVAHPRGFLGRRRRFVEVGEGRPDRVGHRRRGVVERGVAGAATTGGAHRPIVGRGAHPAPA